MADVGEALKKLNEKNNIQILDLIDQYSKIKSEIYYSLRDHRLSSSGLRK